MKYKLGTIQNDDGFKPFSLTLTFETRKEYEHFHNNVMGKLTPTVSHEFHGAVFDMGQGNIDSAQGAINLSENN